MKKIAQLIQKKINIQYKRCKHRNNPNIGEDVIVFKNLSPWLISIDDTHVSFPNPANTFRLVTLQKSRVQNLKEIEDAISKDLTIEDIKVGFDIAAIAGANFGVLEYVVDKICKEESIESADKIIAQITGYMLRDDCYCKLVAKLIGKDLVSQEAMKILVDNFTWSTTFIYHIMNQLEKVQVTKTAGVAKLLNIFIEQYSTRPVVNSTNLAEIVERVSKVLKTSPDKIAHMIWDYVWNEKKLFKALGVVKYMNPEIRKVKFIELIKNGSWRAIKVLDQITPDKKELAEILTQPEVMKKASPFYIKSLGKEAQNYLAHYHSEIIDTAKKVSYDRFAEALDRFNELFEKAAREYEKYSTTYKKDNSNFFSNSFGLFANSYGLFSSFPEMTKNLSRIVTPLRDFVANYDNDFLILIDKLFEEKLASSNILESLNLLIDNDYQNCSWGLNRTGMSRFEELVGQIVLLKTRLKQSLKGQTLKIWIKITQFLQQIPDILLSKNFDKYWQQNPEESQSIVVSIIKGPSRISSIKDFIIGSKEDNYFDYGCNNEARKKKYTMLKDMINRNETIKQQIPALIEEIFVADMNFSSKLIYSSVFFDYWKEIDKDHLEDILKQKIDKVVEFNSSAESYLRFVEKLSSEIQFGAELQKFIFETKQVVDFKALINTLSSPVVFSTSLFGTSSENNSIDLSTKIGKILEILANASSEILDRLKRVYVASISSLNTPTLVEISDKIEIYEDFQKITIDTIISRAYARDTKAAEYVMQNPRKFPVHYDNLRLSVVGQQIQVLAKIKSQEFKTTKSYSDLNEALHDKDENGEYRFWIPVWHGTSSGAFEKILSSGSFLSSEKHGGGNIREVYFSTEYNNAITFAVGKSRSDGTKPVMIRLEVPMCKFLEALLLTGVPSIVNKLKRYRPPLGADNKKALSVDDIKKKLLELGTREIKIPNELKLSDCRYTVHNYVPVNNDVIDSRYAVENYLNRNQDVMEQIKQKVAKICDIDSEHGRTVDPIEITALIDSLTLSDPKAQEFLFDLNIHRNRRITHQVPTGFQSDIITQSAKEKLIMFLGQDAYYHRMRQLLNDRIKTYKKDDVTDYREIYDLKKDMFEHETLTTTGEDLEKSMDDDYKEKYVKSSKMEGNEFVKIDLHLTEEEAQRANDLVKHKLDVFNLQDLHYQGVIPNYIGWVLGTYNKENLFIDEVQSDLFQNIGDLTDPKVGIEKLPKEIRQLESSIMKLNKRISDNNQKIFELQQKQKQEQSGQQQVSQQQVEQMRKKFFEELFPQDKERAQRAFDGWMNKQNKGFDPSKQIFALQNDTAKVQKALQGRHNDLIGKSNRMLKFEAALVNPAVVTDEDVNREIFSLHPFEGQVAATINEQEFSSSSDRDQAFEDEQKRLINEELQKIKSSQRWTKFNYPFEFYRYQDPTNPKKRYPSYFYPEYENVKKIINMWEDLWLYAFYNNALRFAKDKGIKHVWVYDNPNYQHYMKNMAQKLGSMKSQIFPQAYNTGSSPSKYYHLDVQSLKMARIMMRLRYGSNKYWQQVI